MNKKTRNIVLVVALLLVGLLLAFNYAKQEPVDEKEDEIVEVTEVDKEAALEAKYIEALEVAETDKQEASNLLFELGDYKDSREKIKEFKYDYAQELLEEKKYAEAYKIFVSLGNYKDAQDMVLEVRPLKAK